MKTDIGFPFSAMDKQENVLFGIIMGVYPDGTFFYYLGDNGKFIVDKLPDDLDKRRIKLNPQLVRTHELYAKVTDYESSVEKYGMRQRKETFLYSTLQVVEYGKDKQGYYAILQSLRGDGAQLKMDINDLRFVFPVNRKSYYKWKRKK